MLYKTIFGNELDLFWKQVFSYRSYDVNKFRIKMILVAKQNMANDYLKILTWLIINEYILACYSPWNPYWKGRLSTIDLLVLTSFDQLLVLLKILFTYLTKQLTLMRRSTVLLSLPLQLEFPALSYNETAQFLTRLMFP